MDRCTCVEAGRQKSIKCRKCYPRAKPLVKYGSLIYLNIGHSALLNKVVRHPDIAVKGYGLVRTSPVIRLLGKGRFETENTVYEPLEKVRLRTKLRCG